MIFEDFNQRRTQGNEKIMEQNFLPFKRFMNLDTNCYADGAISKLQKELIGLSCSLLLRCNDCVLYHLEQSKNAGANKEQINEAMNVALVVGGSIIIPHLRYALIALDELFTEGQA